MKLAPHRTDGVSLVFGLAFLGGAGLWATGRVVTLHPAAIGWLIAGGLVLLGIVGLVHTVASGRNGPG